MLLQEAAGAGDDHHPIGVGAHDVAVVIDLDPLRRVGQVEQLRDAGQQFALRRAFGHAAFDRFPRIGRRMVHGGALVAALGAVDLHLPPGLDRQRIGQQRGIRRLMADQDQGRRGQVVIELGEEGAEHLLGRLFGLGVGQEIGPVAVVAAAAEEEDLHAGLPGHLVQRHDIRVAQPVDVDPVAPLHMGEAPDAVAQRRRPFEFQPFGGLLHLRRQALLDRGDPAREVFLRLPHQVRIARFVDALHAGGGAALDLEQQAGPGAAVEHRVAAGAQQEDALQRRQRLVHRPGGSEGAPVARALATFPAVLGDLGIGMVLRQDQPGIGFVVAQDDVEARPQALDQIGFEQQRLGLGGGGHDLQAAGLEHHPAQAFGQAGQLGIGRHPPLQAARLADIERIALRIEHPVDAWNQRQGGQRGLDDLHALHGAGGRLGVRG